MLYIFQGVPMLCIFQGVPMLCIFQGFHKNEVILSREIVQYKTKIQNFQILIYMKFSHKLPVVPINRVEFPAGEVVFTKYFNAEKVRSPFVWLKNGIAYSF